MKLWNPAMAGQKLGTKNGILEVGADGSVEVSDEDIQKALQRSGFQSEKPEGKSKAKPQPRQPVQETKEVKPAPEPTPEPKEEVEEEVEGDDGEEEVEIEDLADYTAKDAVAMINEETDIDILEAWLESESSEKKRKTIITCLKNRIKEVS